jgi:hypothetical protein
MANSEINDKTLITIITSENNKEYYLYSDGNLYERDNKGNLKQLDNITEESKNLIKKIMNKFSSGKTDVIRKESSQERMKKKIDIELPIL